MEEKENLKTEQTDLKIPEKDYFYSVYNKHTNKKTYFKNLIEAHEFIDNNTDKLFNLEAINQKFSTGKNVLLIFYDSKFVLKRYRFNYAYLPKEINTELKKT